MIKIEQIFNDEREQKILREVMERLDLSAVATIRYFCRMGQLVDHQIQQGYKLAWVKDGEVVDPFDRPRRRKHCRYCNQSLHLEGCQGWGEEDCWIYEDGPKTTPNPAVPTVRSCNRHSNCDKAEEEVMARRGCVRAEIHSSFHCHDDECEDCFGS